MGPQAKLIRHPGRDSAASRNSATNSKKPKATASKAEQHMLPVEWQQKVLDVFGIAFPLAQNGEQLKTIIQEVKGHLYNRDFAAAFGKPSFLEAYALRWSAARALGYADIFTHPDRSKWFEGDEDPDEKQEHVQVREAVEESGNAAAMQAPVSTTEGLGVSCHSPPPPSTSRTTQIVCIGGGAGAEVVALAAANQFSEMSTTLNILAIDMADWTQPLGHLAGALCTAPPLPKHASEAARARNKALVENSEQVHVRFDRQDVLDWNNVSDSNSFLAEAKICTIMFTLNELFSTSLPKTTAFLLKLTDLMKSGSWLVVVDSPGSYSEVRLGKEGQPKRYPMKWLLDHTLLNVAGKDEDAKWVKKEDQDSVWFRFDQSKLQYSAVSLENMRYQIHVYQRQ